MIEELAMKVAYTEKLLEEVTSENARLIDINKNLREAVALLNVKSSLLTTKADGSTELNEGETDNSDHTVEDEEGSTEFIGRLFRRIPGTEPVKNVIPVVETIESVIGRALEKLDSKDSANLGPIDLINLVAFREHWLSRTK